MSSTYSPKSFKGENVPFTVLVTFVSFGLFSKLKQQKKVRLESECGGLEWQD